MGGESSRTITDAALGSSNNLWEGQWIKPLNFLLLLLFTPPPQSINIIYLTR